MNQCAGCGKELTMEFCAVPRLPCPFCGETGRNYTRIHYESVAVMDSLSWQQTRNAPHGRATIDSSNKMHLRLTGQPPQNEEDTLAVSARLVRRLNADGAAWSEPVPGEADVDAVSIEVTDSAGKLNIQVIRASNDRSMWRTLGREGVLEKSFDVEKAAEELIEAVRQKAAKYPVVQREALTLVLDASRTPSHTFGQVHGYFAIRYRDECRKCGFFSVWVVGAVDALVTRLD